MKLHLSRPSKIPCPSWSLPVGLCKTGMKLTRKGEDNNIPYICKVCYNKSGHSMYPRAQELLWGNWENYSLDPRRWVETLSVLIRNVENCAYFRFFHSGDLQNPTMLKNIVAVAERCPETKFWAPTIERGIVLSFFKQGGVLPENMVVRLSSPIIDQKVKHFSANYDNVCYSRVVYNGVDETLCMAHTHEEYKCQECRRCWNKDEEVVSYPLKVGKNIWPVSTAKRLGLLK